LNNAMDFWSILFLLMYHFGTLRKEDTLAITRAFFTEAFSRGASLSLEQFLARKMDLARQLVGSTFLDQDAADRGAVDAVLLGLPSEFSSFRTTVTLQGQIPVWTELCDLILSWEKAQKGIPQIKSPGGPPVKQFLANGSQGVIKKGKNKNKNKNKSPAQGIQGIQSLVKTPITPEAQSLLARIKNMETKNQSYFSKGSPKGGFKGKGKGKGKNPYSTPDLCDVLCFRCNQKGHYANKCPNPQVSKGKGKGGKN